MTVQIPQDAPFTLEQQTWLSGFLAGAAAARATAETAAPSATAHIDVLYGSQTGNCEGVAEDLVDALGGRGLGAHVTALDDVSLEQLAAMEHVFVVTSTYGEGDMPDNAELFWEALQSPTAPRLESMQYSVLSLGDSAYQNFCQAGKHIDTRFEQLGAVRLAARVDCDVDFDDAAEAWTAEVADQLAATIKADPSVDGGAAPAGGARKKKSKWSRKQPFGSRLAENRLLSGASSTKEIRHFELDLGDSGIEYAAGDALAVVPRNDPALVAALIAALGLDPGDVIDDRRLEDHLLTGREIRTPTMDLMEALAQQNPEGELAMVLGRDERETLEQWLWGKDVLDLVEATPEVALGAGELLDLLRPLQHRAYSISSSPLASPDRIHLTVAAVRHGEDRVHGGVASTFLADRAGAGVGTGGEVGADVGSDTAAEVGIFLQPNAAFRVPEDDDAPMIMIGPGTGVAPFRAFLQEREARGAKGRNWLFFGDQHRECDYIYEQELAGWQESGMLDRLDLAFSRDQTEKIYVQTQMLAAGEELYAWLEAGAHVYVCGDATRMAKDVDEALRTIIEQQCGSADGADDYMAGLKREKRYVRDVY